MKTPAPDGFRPDEASARPGNSALRSPGTWPVFVLSSLLRAYKRFLSPLLPPSCRFTPTCSEYAIEAINRHGVVKGSFLACWRLLRCNPFCRGGYDPVP